MGKQLYFAHQKEDLASFVNYLERIHAKFVINGVLLESTNLLQKIEEDMTSLRFPMYGIVTQDEMARANPIAGYAATGTIIEFSNCWVWHHQDQVYYDKGRIYLSITKEGTYDVNALALYKRLSSYIKKNYHYNKHFDIYFSPRFKAKYEKMEIDLSQLGSPIARCNSNF